MEITKNGQYSNIDLKTLKPGEEVIIEKTFPTGLQKTASKMLNGKNVSWNYYVCKGKYNNTDVSFFLDEQSHKLFADCGGIGDKIKVSASLQPKAKKPTEYVLKFTFSKVE